MAVGGPASDADGSSGHSSQSGDDDRFLARVVQPPSVEGDQLRLGRGDAHFDPHGLDSASELVQPTRFQVVTPPPLTDDTVAPLVVPMNSSKTSPTSTALPDVGRVSLDRHPDLLLLPIRRATSRRSELAAAVREPGRGVDPEVPEARVVSATLLTNRGLPPGVTGFT